MKTSAGLLVMAWAIATAACHAQTPAAPASAPAAALVRLDEGGELVEVERAPGFSIIEVRRRPPGSVPSSLFVLRGSCMVARSRAMPYFAGEWVAGSTSTYRITFPQAPAASAQRGGDQRVFSLADCELLRF